MSLITVKSKTESFRRAGFEFNRAGVEIESSDCTPAQMLALITDPMLTFSVGGEEMPRPSDEDLAELRAQIAEQAQDQADAAQWEQEQADADHAAADKAAAPKPAATKKAAAAAPKKAAEKKAGK